MPQADRIPRLPAFSLILAGLFLSSLACSSIPFLAPTATPTPTDTPTPTVTPTVTPTPTATLTPTRTITPTVSYLDWPIVFSDTFDDEYNGWYTGTDSDEYVKSDVSIAGGKYIVKATAKKPFFWWLYADLGILEDFYLSVEVKANKGLEQADYGLWFRGSDVDFYSFTINATTRQYGLKLFYEDDLTTLIRWSRSQKLDPAGSNQIAVLAQGSQFTLFLNGEEVNSLEDDTLDKGKVGIYIGIWNAGDTLELEFDNFDVTAPKKGR
jgi:hypothetical protein